MRCYVMYLQGSKIIKALIAKEQKRQKKMFRHLRLKDNSLKGMHITTKCLSGFELYQDVICGQLPLNFVLFCSVLFTHIVLQ